MINNLREYSIKTLKALFIFLSFFFVLRFFVVEPTRVNNRSMEPNFIDDDFLLVNKLSSLFIRPTRGVVVQFINPVDQKLLIKRVIGLPGERVRISGKKVEITEQNGVIRILNEPYIQTWDGAPNAGSRSDINIVVPDDSYFLLGDNRHLSIDSRYFGPVQRSYIIGVVTKLDLKSWSLLKNKRHG